MGKEEKQRLTRSRGAGVGDVRKGKADAKTGDCYNLVLKGISQGWGGGGGGGGGGGAGGVCGALGGGGGGGGGVGGGWGWVGGGGGGGGFGVWVCWGGGLCWGGGKKSSAPVRKGLICGDKSLSLDPDGEIAVRSSGNVNILPANRSA